MDATIKTPGYDCVCGDFHDCADGCKARCPCCNPTCRCGENFDKARDDNGVIVCGQCNLPKYPLRSTDATPEALALARKCAAEDYANAYSENGEACEDILSETRESYRARIASGPEYDGPTDDAAQEYACAYTDLVRESRPVCPEACDHD